MTLNRMTLMQHKFLDLRYISMGDKWKVYNSIRLPHIFLGSPGTCACSVYQALSPPPPPPLEWPGNEASKSHDDLQSDW